MSRTLSMFCLLLMDICTVNVLAEEVLNLAKDAVCMSHGVNGTCLDLFTCHSAALTHLYRKAGYTEELSFPPAPATCSHNQGEGGESSPVVCCTDCDSVTRSGPIRKTSVGPMGVLYSTEGPVAWAKCLEQFERLPYPCRGEGNVKVTKVWDEVHHCHSLRLDHALAVGGRDAERWEFPHMALLGYGDNSSAAQWLCGGSVISERYILTAAHCSSTRALGPIKFAALGLLKRTDPKDTWKIYNIKRIIIHPQFKAPSKYHDIALLETDTEINFGKDLLPACLDVGKESISHADAPGWGRLGHRQALADNLQVVELDEYNETECGTYYQPHRHLLFGFDHQTQMCYGSHYHLTDTCEGDSGGPLQKHKFKCLYTVVGVTSYGKDCGVLGSPGMYTRVAHYVPWIESVVWPGETNL